MKVLLLGAGGQGGPCASILARDPEVREVKIADFNLDRAQKVVKKIGNSKIKAIRLDASDEDAVANEAYEKDAIIDLVSLSLAPIIMRAALKANVHYVNTAFSREFWDFKLEVGKKPLLYEKFVDKNLTALLGCGMSPGYTNILIKHYSEQLDIMRSVKLRLAKKDSSVTENEEIMRPWNPGWNPRIAFMDFVNSVTVFRDNEYKTYDEPFSEIEEFVFPEPLGKTLVALHAHEEPYSMPSTFANKQLAQCDFKYYVNKQVAPMVALGFGRIPEVTVKGSTVSPLDVLLELVPKPGDSFFTENQSNFAHLDKTKHVAIVIQIEGIKNGQEKKYNIYIPDMNNPRAKLYELFGCTQINVALPAVIGMKMVVKGAPKGVIFPEQLDSEEFIKLIQSTGYPNHWTEL